MQVACKYFRNFVSLNVIIKVQTLTPSYKLDTSELDSILMLSASEDSVLVMPRDFSESARPFDPLLDTARIMSLTAADTTAVAADSVVAVVPAWKDGLEPQPRAVRPGNFSGFLIVLTVLFVVLAFNFNNLRRLVKVYGEELVKVRHGRDNVFDDRPAGDVRVMVVLILQFIVGAGILVSGAVSRMSSGDAGLLTLPLVGKITALVGLYYLFELAAYQTVGYTFSTPEGRREWIRGFNSSQALLGLALAIPAIMVIFYPSTTLWMLEIGLLVYFVARIMFIVKGFRIFYNKITSILYFILYLCTLEIVPALCVCGAAGMIVGGT